MNTPKPLTLELKRCIRATPQRLFEAWTTPEQLLAWWGPDGVRCVGAHVDLRVGGHYWIDNLLPDGRVVRIEGEFLRIEVNRTLIYTWRMPPDDSMHEEVCVQFEAQSEQTTELCITHTRIGNEATRQQHQQGWQGCLDGLTAHMH